MNYEKALKLWGRKKLAERFPSEKIHLDDVQVEMEFYQGYACCGGTDPLCYCSFAESPSALVVIRAGFLRYEINANDFDFAKVLSEIVQAADGAITK